MNVKLKKRKITTLFVLLTLIVPIVAIIYVPKWMKKNDKGKNTIVRMLAGFGCASVLFIVFITLFSVFTSDEKQNTTMKETESIYNNQSPEINNPEKTKFTQFAYYKRDPKRVFNYRIFVYITDASPKDMDNHAKKQKWSSHGTTMVCYFRNADGLDSNAITLAKNVDIAINEIWKPTLVARYIHWPTGKEQCEENSYVDN